MKKILYFLCTGNSCRSQIAEGFGKKYLHHTYDVYSAGIEAHGVNSNAMQVMNEINIDISNQTSNTIDVHLLHKADLVITLCGDARDSCPTLPAKTAHRHWGFSDPAIAEGTDEEKQVLFRKVRDDIEARIKNFNEDGK